MFETHYATLLIGYVVALAGWLAAVRLLPGLLRDAALGVVIISALRRARDIIWFWPVHFTMDMAQFDAVTFGG